MAEKVVGFKIEIKGNKELLTTEKLLGMVNQQLTEINNNLDEINKKGGANLGKLSRQFKESATSAERLGTVVKSSFQTFEKGNKTVQEIGKTYIDVTEKVEEFGQELNDGSSSIKDLIERNKELKQVLQDADIDDTSEELAQLRQEYSDNRDAILGFNRELRTGVKETEVSEDSILGLRNTVRELTKQYNALSKEQREATEGQEIKENLAATVKELKSLEEAVGDNRRSVGDYKKAFEGLGGSLGPVKTGLNGVRAGFNLLVKNPLLAVLTAIVSAITGLVAAFRSTKEGAEAFDRATAAVSATLDVVRDIAVSVGKALFSIFSDPIGSIKAFGTAIKDGVVSVLGGVVDLVVAVGSGIKSLVTLDFEGLKQAGQDAGQVLQNGFNNAVAGANALTNAISNTTDEIQREAAEAARLTGVLQELTDTQRQLSVQRAELNAQLVETRALSRDTTKSIEERVDALNEVREAERKQLSLEIDAQQKRVDALKALAAQSDSSKETLDEIAQAEISLANLRSQSASSEIAIQRELDRLNNERKKQIEQETKDREELLKQIRINAEARVELTLQLNDKLRDAEISGLKSREEQLIEAEKRRFEKQKQARIDAFDELKVQTKQQENELIKLFGKGSQEVIDFRKKSGAELLIIQKQINALTEKEEEEHQERLLKIRNDGAENRVKITTGGFSKLSTALKDGLQKTVDATKAAQEQAAATQEDILKQTKEQAINLLNVTIQSIADISNAAFQAEDQRFQESIDRRKQNIENLNQDLANATGLQKRYLEQQVENEKKALAEETAAREKARKEQAEAQKAIAIVQAIVGAALGIVNAFQLPPPASFVAAAATAVATAAQIAVIASQKFANGGILSGPSHAKGGIKTAFGELEGGEAVINKRSTAMFKPLLSSINAAGGGRTFATGGILGSPVSAPSLASSPSMINADFNKFLQGQQEQTAAINARIDRIQVVQDLNNLQDIQDNDETLNTLTTFN